MFDFEIARFFYKLSSIYGILEGSKYRSRSFRNAAMALDAYSTYVSSMHAEGNLKAIPYVGGGIERRINEICETRHLTELDELENRYSIENYSILLSHGLSGKLVAKLFAHDIRTANQLEDIIGTIESTMAPVWLSVSEVHRIKMFLKEYHENHGLYLLSYGHCIAEELVELMLTCGYHNARISGEVNQALDRIHDVEIVYSDCDTLSKDRLKQRLAAETPRYHQTIFSENFVAGIAPLDLPFCIHPINSDRVWSRDNWENLQKGIRGDLHLHTNWSDGIHTLEAVALRAEELGYEYQAITDHSTSMRIAHGMTELQALEQIKEIRTYNETHEFKLLAGIEVDILPDGTLDYSDALLDQYDIVVAAIHTSFNQDRDTLMARLEKALSNPRVNILAHPTGRLLGRPGILFSSRNPYDVDIDALIQICKKNDVALEVNCFPERLDLCRESINKAVVAGVRISLGTDSHSVAHMSNILYGAINVRSAAVPDAMLLNTYSYKELLALLQTKKSRTPAPQRTSLMKKDFQYYFGANSDISSGNATVIGIDLTGSEEKETGWAFLRAQEALCRKVKTDSEIIASIVRLSPTVVSIDSPLAYPRGRQDPSKDSPDKGYGISRESERNLRHFGIGVYPCLIDSMVNVTTRGMRLSQRLRDMGYTVIESYPGAAQDVLQIPRKGKTKEQFEHLKKGLASFGMKWTIEDGREITHDEADAITSALVGYFYLNNQYVALGNSDEDYLIVPRIQEELLDKRTIVGLSGETAAGKTTVANYLVFKYGFGYFRYSQIIEDEYDVHSKQKLQEIGKKISENPASQMALTEDMINHMENSKSYVIDGIRHMEDYITLRQAFGESFIFVYVDCSYNRRSQRYRDESRHAVDSVYFEELSNHPSERDIKSLGNMAVVRIDNNGTYKRLREQADMIVKQYATE